MPALPFRTGLRLFVRFATLALVALWAFGCAPRDPLDATFDGVTPVDFTFRRSQLTRTLSVDQCKDFDDAVLELKYEVMAFAEAKGSEAVMAAVLEKIHERTLREIMGLGFSAKLRRLEAERAKMEAVVDHNNRLYTRPDDTASADYLQTIRAEQARRVEKIKEDILRARQKLAELGGLPVQAEPSPSPSRPPVRNSPASRTL